MGGAFPRGTGPSCSGLALVAETMGGASEATEDQRYPATAFTFTPAASRRASFLSTDSQVKAFSVRPK